MQNESFVNQIGITTVESLAKLPSSKLTSFLLRLFQIRSSQRTRIDISGGVSPYIAPCDIDQRVFHDFDSVAFTVLPQDFKTVEFSPLTQFGLNSVLAGISQNKVFSTTRDSEVLADPTTQLAFLCAQHRRTLIANKKDDDTMTSFASSSRVIRQATLENPNYRPHFRTLAIATAGRDTGFEKFERESMLLHFGYILDLLLKLNSRKSFSISNSRIVISNADKKHSELPDIVVRGLRDKFGAKYPDVEIVYDDELVSNYYNSLYYRVYATNNSQVTMSIAGGGFTNWTQKINNLKTERVLVGGIGSETLCRMFKV